MFGALRFFFSSRRRHTRWPRDWSSDVCSSDLLHLRIWFDDGIHGFEQLSPDQPVVPTAYAQRAAAAEIATTALEASTVAVGSIGAAQLDSDFEANLAKLDGDVVFSGAVTAGSFVGDE